MKALILHGGCEEGFRSDTDKKYANGRVEEYGAWAWEKLAKGASALDVLEAVLVRLEDDPFFDAGIGSFLNTENEVEMDALIMDNRGDGGGVVCLKNMKHPIQVARLIMEHTPHLLLSGDAAYRFALKHGFEHFDITSFGTNKYAPESMPGEEEYQQIRESDHSFSTVGAVVLDDSGYLVAGTTTGGIKYKLPGRIGDSAIPGAGTYCETDIGVVATGEGEKIMKLCLCRDVASRTENNSPVEEACDAAIQRANEHGATCGVVALDKTGNWGFAHNGTQMPVYTNRAR